MPDTRATDKATALPASCGRGRDAVAVQIVGNRLTGTAVATLAEDAGDDRPSVGVGRIRAAVTDEAEGSTADCLTSLLLGLQSGAGALTNL